MSQPRHGSDAETTSSLLPAGAASAVPMSGKQREVLSTRNQNLARVHNPTPSVSTLSNPYSTSASGTEDLRAEVEQLRREMESIRNIAEPPPGYA